MTQMDNKRIQERISTCLQIKPGLKASEISLRLQIEKKDINSILYNELKNEVIKDDEFRWYLKDYEMSNINNDKTAEEVNTVSDNITKIDAEYLLATLEKTRQKLLDNTKRNRLINYRETAKDVAVIDEMADLVFEDLVFEEKCFYFSCYEEIDDEDVKSDLFSEEVAEPNRTLPETNGARHSVDDKYSDEFLQTPYVDKDLERRLRKLYTEHKSLIEETGANSLYLAMGFLEWSDHEYDEKKIKSPLMLVPVRIAREGTAGQAKYSLSFDDEALDSNYSLIEKLRNDFDINIPLLEDEEKPESYWERVDESIQNKHKDGWLIIKEMSLGLYRFSKQIMWHDLDPNRWPKHAPLTDKKVIQRILLGAQAGEKPPGQLSGEYPQDGEEKDVSLPDLKLIRDADSSQYSALIDSLSSENGLVIEGPPGTGKSQTITNLIAAAMDEGKTVLFVAEKMAALRVVYDRLEEVGLGAFCLQLHGLKTSKKELLADVARRIEYRSDSIADIQNKVKQLAQAKESLIEYSKALNERAGPEGLALYEIAWRVEVLRQKLPDNIDDLELEVSHDVSYEDFYSLKSDLDNLGKEWSGISSDARDAWSGYLASRYNENNQSEVMIAVEEVINTLSSIDDVMLKIGGVDKVPEILQIKRLLKFKSSPPDDAIKAIPVEIDEGLIYRTVSGDLFDTLQDIVHEIDDYLSNVKQINNVLDYASENSGSYCESLNEYVNSIISKAVYHSVNINELNGERSQFETIASYLNDLPVLTEPYLTMLNSVARTVSDYKEIIDEVVGLTKGPVELSIHSNVHHVKASIKNHLSQAHEDNKNLFNEVSSQSGFNFDRIKSSKDLEIAKDSIEKRIGSFFSFFSSDYRSAKRTIKSILKDSNEFKKSQDFVDRLDKLYQTVTEVEKFKANDDYKLVLGSLFKGLETDWKKLDNLIDFSQNLREKLGVEAATKILADWDSHIDEVVNFKEDMVERLQTIDSFKAKHPFPDNMWQRPVAEISDVLSPWITKISEADKALNQPWCGSSITLDEALKTVDLFKITKRKESVIEAHRGFDSLLGSWRKSETDIRPIKLAYAWIEDVINQPGFTLNILKWMYTEKGEFKSDRYRYLYQNVIKLVAAIDNAAGVLGKYGDLDITLWLGGEKSFVSHVSSKLELARESISNLILMRRWSEASEDLKQRGFSTISDLVSVGGLKNEECGYAYEYWLYKRLLEEKIQANKVLAGFSKTKYDSLRDQFTALDKELMVLNAKQIANKLSKKTVKQGNGSGKVSTFTEKSLLTHEINKKSRHRPIRQLIKNASNAFQSLKPCFLMSPLSVAQYLGAGDIHFDLIVMDEASQLRPEDAIGAISRGTRSIVVGDPKQLPPTSFFDAVSKTDEESEETILDDTESILDVCLKQFQYRRLRWHYRSEHESLIQFSNEKFYDHDLVVFPSPKPDTREYGVHHTYIKDPSYKKGKNRREAEVVVENIIHHFHRHGKKSLGVATFNKAQAEEITNLLERHRQKDPGIDAMIKEHEGSEPLFIKNLENVQGDERDVIFISTTYGPEAAGEPVAQRFGPINSDVGWRRLNVIATRAKQRVEVFTSLRSTDIVVEENANRGKRALRDYLEFAESGKITERGFATGKEPDSDFEIAVIKMINNLGYECDPQVGVAGFFIDIGIRNPDRPGEYLLGVECDGATYHSAKSVRDRDRLRQQILENKGWQIHRIWSTNWFQTRSTEIERLERVIQQAIEADRNRFTVVEDYIEAPEILVEAEYATDEEIQSEILEEELQLEDALERFWERYIKPDFPDKSRSILSEEMINVLAKRRPTTTEEWFNLVPADMRQKIEPNEGEFRQDIFDMIEEYE